MRLSPAQQRVLDYLLEHRASANAFIDVPYDICRDERTFEWLEERGLIQSRVVLVKTTRAEEPRTFYRRP